MKKNKKPSYETPVILPLGELAKGQGAVCRVGSVPTGQCADGGGVPPSVPCTTGGRAGGSCSNGPNFPGAP